MNRLSAFLVLHLALMILPRISLAWSGDTPARRRIGLALQGGGAKGFAHIGVLQWLEENRIPADLIAGTSMGGLIGGFYAAGRGTAELKDLVRSLNWDELIGGQQPSGSWASGARKIEWLIRTGWSSDFTADLLCRAA